MFDIKKLTVEMTKADQERRESDYFRVLHEPAIMELARLFQCLAFPDQAADLLEVSKGEFRPAPLYVRQACSLADRPALRSYLNYALDSVKKGPNIG